MLGRAYLINENTLRLIDMARQGATLNLGDGDSVLTVTAANADAVSAEFERRRAAYATAIRGRGFATIAGEYELAQPKCAEPLEPVIVSLTQQEFVVSLEGEPAGVVVARTLVVGQGDGSDNAYRHGSLGERIVLEQFESTRCTTLLTPYRRPQVRLERPERLIGSWEGRWDGTYDVRLTVAPTDTGYDIHYEWREYVGGEFQTMTLHAHAASQHSIRAGPIQIFEDGNGARAEGHFARTRRTALRRVE